MGGCASAGHVSDTQTLVGLCERSAVNLSSADRDACDKLQAISIQSGESMESLVAHCDEVPYSQLTGVENERCKTVISTIATLNASRPAWRGTYGPSKSTKIGIYVGVNKRRNFTWRGPTYQKRRFARCQDDPRRYGHGRNPEKAMC